MGAPRELDDGQRVPRIEQQVGRMQAGFREKPSQNLDQQQIESEYSEFVEQQIWIGVRQQPVEQFSGGRIRTIVFRLMHPFVTAIAERLNLGFLRRVIIRSKTRDLNASIPNVTVEIF